MNRLSQWNQIICLGVAAVLVASRASATVTYTIGNGGLEPFNVAIDGTSYGGALAGGIALSKVSGDGPQDYVTLCTDIQGTLYLGTSYTYDSPVAFAGLNGVSPRWGADNAGKTVADANNTSAIAAIQNAAVLFYTYYSFLSGSSTTDKAALQLAVWAALYNTTGTGAITGNRFTFGGGDADAVSLANTMLSKIVAERTALGYTPSGGIFYPDPVNGQQHYGNPDPPQELLFFAPPPPTPRDRTAVPEPTTVIAGALLLIPFGGSIIRILRRNRSAEK